MKHPPERKKTSQHPKAVDIAPRNASEMIKPQEMIEMVEMAPLSLASRRIYNLLVKHAWNKIEDIEHHSIGKKLLRLGMGNASERLGKNIREIMSVIIERRDVNKVHRFHLLGYNTDDNDESDEALFHYTFPPPLRQIIRTSEIWARLESQVIYAFSSKYALALYELIALRANLKHKTSEVIELEKFRAIIGVEKGKLNQFFHFKQRAIDYAVREVNGLCPDFNVIVDPVTTGRKVTAVKVTWWPKSAAEKAASLREITGSRIGRRERLAGTVVKIVEPPKVEAKKGKTLAKVKYSPHNTHLTGDDINEGKALLKSLNVDADIYAIEAEWRESLNSDPIPVVKPKLNFLQYIRDLK